MSDRTPDLRGYFDALAAPLDAQPMGPSVPGPSHRARRLVLAAAVVLLVALAALALAVVREPDENGVIDDATPEESADLPPFCADLSPPDPGVTGDIGGNPDPYFMGVLQTYLNNHPDTAAGIWIDRGHDVVVLAFTDDPAPHEETISELRMSDVDEQFVGPGPEITETTTVAESGYTVAVVQVDHSLAELDSVMKQVEELDTDALGLHGWGRMEQIGRVFLSLDVADIATRQQLATQLPLDAICVDGPAEAPAPLDPGSVDLLSVEADPLVECMGAQFRLSALDAPADFEHADGELADALREELATAPEGMPGTNTETGWRVLSQDDETALLAAGTPPHEYISFNRENDGWVWSGSGGGGEPCDPRRAVPEGVVGVEWWLDANHPMPGPPATEIHVLISPRECTNGEPVGDRLLEPQLEVTDEEIVVGLAAEPLPPRFYHCPGIPPEAVTIELPEPLGHRVVVDALHLAPRPPVERLDQTVGRLR